MSPIDVYKLSFSLQLAIASGYLAYVISYAGIRQHHTTADTVLKSAAFGLPAMAIMSRGYQHPFWTPAVSVAVALAIGVAWRLYGATAWQSVVRRSGVSWADDIPTAWLGITATKTTSMLSQISVELTDGRVLLCEDTAKYIDAHEGPCLLGLNGDVGLYVDAEMRPDGTWKEKNDTRHATFGDLMTYVPVAEIKRVEMRYITAKAEKAALKAAAKAKAAGGEPSPEGTPASAPSD